MTSIDDPRAALEAPATREWLRTHAGFSDYTAESLAGGNSNDTFMLRSSERSVIVRCPPRDPVDPSAHNLQREHRVLSALDGTSVRAPGPVALCTDGDVPAAPFLAMERCPGHALTDSLPVAYDADTAPAAIGREMVEALGELHAVDWRAAGLEGYGRPDGFLDRQVSRWRRQYERNAVRDVPEFLDVARALEARTPAPVEPTLIHGDFHLDNCLFDADQPRLNAIIDWEMSTIGDPRIDLGLMLAFWGDRGEAPPAMPRIQAVSRTGDSPDRASLASHYEEVTGRDVVDLPYFMALAFWKLAAIVEGAYALYVEGRLTSEYARRLGDDVPALVREASLFLHRD